MSGILVVAEARRGALRDITYELIGAAGAIKDVCGGRVAVLVVGQQPDAYASQLDRAGVDEVLAAAAPVAHFEPHVAQLALAAALEAEQPEVVLLGHTIDSLGFAASAAARLGLGFATDVTALGWDGGLWAKRRVFGDRLEAELDFPDKRCTLLTLRPGAFPAATATGAAPPVRAVEVAFPGPPPSEQLELREAPAADVDITKAPFLLSIGRGVEDRDDVERFEELAQRLGATLTSSRPLVDAGWVPSARQVGQSGRTVKPKVYLALGISGAVQHLAGMRNADTIIAVNTDPEAPIFDVAHYGAVADLFEIADALEAQAQ